ncbi:MAG: phosphoenolpyruvate carboxylase [Rickettsiales bacterium]
MTNYTARHSQNPLDSTNPLTLAYELSNRQIDIIKNNEELGGDVVADKLKNLRDVVWGNERSQKPASAQIQNSTFSAVFKDLNKHQKEQLISSYARMGHLYEISLLSARSNYLKKMKSSHDKTIPGGVAELISKNNSSGNRLSVSQLVEQLNQPTLEIVMTAHPTNVNSLASMKAQREINKALELDNNDEKEKIINRAIKQYQTTPIPHQVEKEDGTKETKNLTVRDEIEKPLYYLGNIYEDLPRLYKHHDDALATVRGGDGAAKYDPTTLNLKAKFGSWASAGDKDGNIKITAENTLEAVALHTQAILKRYHKDLEKLDINELNEWKTKFNTALEQLEPLLRNIEKLRADAQKDEKDKDKDSTPARLSGRFDNLSKELAKIRSNLGKDKDFENDLLKNSKRQIEEKSGKNQDSLNLLRRFRTFGFNFAKIEYRETAKEYDRVVGEVIGKVQIGDELVKFSELTPQQKVETLTKILQKDGNKAAELFQKAEEKIITEGAGKKYSDDTAMPIAYHTFKRMALARDFNDMIRDNVLAETGQLEKKKNGDKPTSEETVAQGVANMLEAKFVQMAVEKKEKDGKIKRPVLGIVPLFEEPDTMTNIDRIMSAAYENEAYKKHLHDVLHEKDKPNLTQQVMIAHSDNARRAGSVAARAHIHDAHIKMRKLNEKRRNEEAENIKTEFFEGGSISDTYRNGVKAISTSVNDFELHDFAKMTFQGGDLLNYFNHPSSTARLFDRQLAHQAEALIKGDDGEWTIKKEARNGHNSNEVANNIAINALKETQQHYQEKNFTEETMGTLLAALDYKKFQPIMNDSSRGNRGSVIKNPKTTIGATITEIEPINVEKIRTISASKTAQGSGLVLSWVGSKSLEENIIKNINDKITELNRKKEQTKDEKEFIENMSNHTAKSNDKTYGKNDKLTAKQLHYIFEKSPAFRDAINNEAFAIAMTDLDAAKSLATKNLQDSSETAQNGKKYLDRLQRTYTNVSKLAYKSLTGHDSPFRKRTENKTYAHGLTHKMPYMEKDITIKTNYRNALLHWKMHNPEIFDDLNTGRAAQSAQDTVEHGRWLGVSDPTFVEQQRNSGIRIS